MSGRSQKNAEKEQVLSSKKSLLHPLVTSADVGRSGYARVQFDGGIGLAIEEYANRRAPSEKSKWGHLVGIAGELAVAAWQGVRLDPEVYPPYEGDAGYDLKVPCRAGRDVYRIEVKTTQDRSNPEQTVAEDKICKADMFVLCTTVAPKRNVEIVGYATRPMLKAFGDVYGHDKFLLSPEFLHPVQPVCIGPEEVREVQTF